MARLARHWKTFYGVKCRVHIFRGLARLARQWMKERGMIDIVCTLIVGFIYLVARLARQWMKERGMIVCTLIVGFIYLVARLARLVHG